MKRIYLLFSLLVGCIYSYAAIYNVKDFGAKADGKTIDSPAINSAIEAAAQAGGGTVYLPAGEYACYSIRLKSNIHLYLEQGARIVAAFPGKEEGYDTAEPNEHNKYQDFLPFHTLLQYLKSLSYSLDISHESHMHYPRKFENLVLQALSLRNAVLLYQNRQHLPDSYISVHSKYLLQ